MNHVSYKISDEAYIYIYVYIYMEKKRLVQWKKTVRINELDVERNILQKINPFFL